MKQEDKELLLKDLCARLPYKVKGIITYDESDTTFTVEGIDNNVLHLSDAEECYVEDFKPYLRPLSSMTEEEREEYKHIAPGIVIEDGIRLPNINQINWLNAHHFDYRGLIEKGLAIAVTEEKKENKSFAILTNTKTGKIFRLKSVNVNKGVFTGQLHIDPNVIIVAENIQDSIPVIGRMIISYLPDVVKKKDVIGDNEKLHVAVFDSNEIMQYDFYIYNAWIQDVNEETNTIVLNCDHIS